MIVTELLKDLSQKGIQLWVEGNNLRYRAPQGILTPTILDILRQHKAEILEQLRLAVTSEELSFQPLSHGQKALWFLYELAPDSVAYNLFATVRIASVVDIDKLNLIWQILLERHPILRTVYTTHHGQPVQLLKDIKVDIPLVDAANWSEEIFNREILAEADRPFNLEMGPILCLNLYARSPQEYILLLVVHHIAFDFWSLDLLLHEFQILYREISQNGQNFSPTCLTSCLSYTNYINWQQQKLASAEEERLWHYWQKKLAGELPILHLPTDRIRPAVQTYVGASYTVNLDEQLVCQLKALAKAERTTLYTTLMAAFQVLLYRYTDQEDILVGTPTLGRDIAEFEGIVGYFTNPVVVRGDASLNPTFKEFLDRIRRTVLDALENADYPFPLLIERLKIEREPSRSPIFQVSFTFNELRRNTLAKLSGVSDEIEIETLTLGQRGAGFDLDLTVLNQAGSLVLKWIYNTDLFEVATIERMAGHFQTLLEGIVAHPKQTISALLLLTPVERHQLLVEWNNTFADYPQDKCIHQLFEEQVELNPDAVAVVFEEEQLTYRELNTKANQLAHYLQSLGVGTEVLVGICVERSVEMIIGLLGILKTGGAYVPLDPTYPSERLTFMLEDSAVSVLLTQSKLVEKLPTLSACVVCLDSNWEKMAFQSEDNPSSPVKPENLAYVIYTSGSTGFPKGVLIQHGSLVNYTTAAIALYEIEKCDSVRVSVRSAEALLRTPLEKPKASADRILQFSSISFDVSAEEIYISLTSGATLVLRTDSMLDSVGVFLHKCIDWKLTVLALPTAYWHELTVFLSQEKFALPPSLRLVIIGGEKALTERLKTWLEYVGQRVRLVNNYGPTESTVGATIYDLSAAKTASTAVPIGRPIWNVQTYILDRSQQPVPIGVPGELYIGGDGLARGYLNRLDLTDKKFIPNPFSDERDSRLYKTGDLASYLPNGNIEFLGRIDNQVKIRGFRIELGEIETAISQHPSVKETIVIATENNIGNKQLVAYIVSQTEVVPPINNLRNFLKQKLPDYMIPTAFIMLETLPLTPNGKIDTFALPKPETAYQQLATTRVPPQTSTQKILATIWAEVLQIQQIGIHDNFFELGGDSILSIQIIARCHQANLKLTPKDLFQHQTIAELAQIVTPSTEIPAEQGLVTGHVPLTPIQQWLVEQNLPEPHHFNQSFLFEISPNLKPELLQQVLQQLLLHHDALRLRLISFGNTWQLLNAAAEETEIFSTIDLSEIAPTEQIAGVETAAAQLQNSLNLSDGPIIRVTLFHLGNHQPNRLLIIIHHLAVDGVSWRILLEDLITVYQQLSRGETIQLPAKTTSFKDWAVRLTEYAQSQTAIAELDYWLTQEESKIAPLPVDYPSQTAENKIADTAVLSVSLSVEQTSALLKEVPSAYNTQINDVLLTALVQSFAQWTGQTSLLIDLEGHGREELFEDINLSRTVGWFTSVFPVLLKLEKAEFPGKSLKSIKEQLRRIPKRGIGYGIIRYLSQDETTRHQLQHLPKAQVCFNYLGQFDQILSAFPILGLAKESSASTISLKASRSHLLEIDGFVADGKLQLSWAYNTKLHQRATIEHLANSFIESLTAIISHCLSLETFGYTPTDFPDADLTQAELDELLESLTPKTQIESIYPLSPMQEGMLFHTLYAPNSGVYFEQLVLTLGGNLNVSAFEQAWRQVVELHPILRTFFVWKNRQHPLQVVCKSVNLPWNIYDWRSLEEVEYKVRLAAFLQTERERGFELDKAPLMWCTLLQLADDNYQFVWSHHHLLMDGWCLPIVLKEVWAFYEAMNRGENLYLDAPPPYRNYIVWLRQQDLSAAEKFWRSTLAGFTAPTPMVVDKLVGNLSQQKDIYDEQNIKLSATLTDALKELARQNHLTLNTLVQGAWALLLSRYSGESDVVFGATVSGRPPALSGVESMVGLFINTLPVRVQISPETELLSWLKQLQVQQVEREQYFYSPLVEIQGLSDVPRNLPLFNSIVVFENYPVDPSFLKGKGSVEISNVRSFERTNYPLTVAVLPGRELSIQIIYDTTRFDDDTVSRLIGHLQTLLSGIVAHSRGRVCELPLLTKREKQQLLVEWNDTAKEYFQDKCIHQLFEMAVERSPSSVAVVFEGQQLTYRELNARANQLAHHLRSLGVGPEVLVGICVERSFEMIIGLLGVLKAGGAYVPIDPAYPSERIAYMLDDSRLPVLLTQQKLVASLPEHQARVVCLDADWEKISVMSELDPITGVMPENLAYVIYTSGSTGKPKGVLIAHRGLCNLATAQIQLFDVKPNSRILQFASLSFDASIWEIVMALCAGAKLCLGTRESLQMGQPLLQLLQEQRITHVALVPTALAALPTQELPALQNIIVGGELCPANLVVQWAVGRRFFNAYGPTETTVCATVAQCFEGMDVLPIGRPIDNTQIYILDRHLQPLPISIPGELHIASVGLARGYLNRPDLTEAKFIPNPFCNEPGSRLYKTGDLGRYLPDGNIEFLGRIDNQVKIRGFRIELGEIEAVLRQHPDILSAAVIDQEDTPGNKRLVAYVVSNLIPERVPYHSECQLELDGNAIKLHTENISTGGVALVGMPTIDEGQRVRLHLLLPGESEPRWLSGTVAWFRPPQIGVSFNVTFSEQALVDQSVAYQVDTQDLWKTLQRTLSGSLRDYLKQKLPDYMIPSAFVLMKVLPLTPNGKINYRALPALESFDKEREDNFVAPRTPTEAKLAAIWAEVLGLKTVGINDNFFELGGHSLQAVSLVSKLSVEMNLTASVKLIFSHPTIAELAEALNQLFTQNISFDPEEPQTKIEETMTASLTKTTDISPFLKLEQRSLLSLFAVGKIAPVDSAALSYIPLYLLKGSSLTRNGILQDWFDNMPMWDAVMDTKWGRIAGITLPIFEDQLYSDPQKLVQMVVEALEMAKRLGAKTVSFTGLIPSATDYGRAILKAVERRTDLPTITTGYATTCSAVVLTIKKILQISNRSLEQETVAFIGLGSVGVNTLRLMLKCLPHPESIILCDVYSKLESIQNIQREMIGDLGFRGSIQIATSSSELPPEIYDATFIIGATNVPDILDIERVKPGTLIVDDSGPHCFSSEQAIKRFEEQKDILFTEGGVLQAPYPMESVIHLPELIKNNMDKNSWSAYFGTTNPLYITGCVLSGLLSSRFDHMKSTVGLLNVETCVQHYQGLEQLGFQAADLHCEGYVLQVEPK